MSRKGRSHEDRKASLFGGSGWLCFPFQHRLTVLRQFLDGQHRQIVLPCIYRHLLTTGHAAIGVHQLAQDRCRAQAGQARQVHRTFGMPTAGQHPAIAGAQRKKTCPGLTIWRCSALERNAASMVVMRSWALTPVVIPSAASMVTVKPVPCRA